MDLNYPPINEDNFKFHDWTPFYGDVQEAIPVKAPAPRGKEVVIQMMVDRDHDGDEADGRSRTGYMIYVKMSLIDWVSKKQSTVEKDVFGSEFVAMTYGVETLSGIRYNLRMMGVPIDGTTYIFGDNMSIIFKTSIPESKLDNKLKIICYHAIQEAVAMGKCMTTHIPI